MHTTDNYEPGGLLLMAEYHMSEDSLGHSEVGYHLYKIQDTGHAMHILETDSKSFAHFKAGRPGYNQAGQFQSWPRHSMRL